MWAVLQWMARLYVLTDLRILRISGVFNVTIFDCPLRKVARTRAAAIDARAAAGLGSIEIIPLDDDAPEGVWQTIARPRQVHEQVVAAINKAKQGCAGVTSLRTADPAPRRGESRSDSRISRQRLDPSDDVEHDEIRRLARRDRSDVASPSNRPAPRRVAICQRSDRNLRRDLVQQAQVVDEVQVRRAGAAVGADGDVDPAREHLAPAVRRVAEVAVRARAVDDARAPRARIASSSSSQ